MLGAQQAVAAAAAAMIHGAAAAAAQHTTGTGMPLFPAETKSRLRDSQASSSSACPYPAVIGAVTSVNLRQNSPASAGGAP